MSLRCSPSFEKRPRRKQVPQFQSSSTGRERLLREHLTPKYRTLICFASVTELTSVDLQRGVAIGNHNQLNTLLGKDKKNRAYIIEFVQSLAISEVHGNTSSHANMHLIIKYYTFTRTESINTTEEQLYNLWENIEKKTNVALKYPEKKKKLKTTQQN